MHPPTEILLPTLGSAGDVYPFIRLGLALQERGHHATLITNPHFEAAAQRAGLDFIALGTDAFYEMLTSHPDVWHPRKGPLLLAEQGLPLVLRPLYDILCRFDPAHTVVVGSSSAIAGRIMQEQHGMPLITVFNQPAYLFSLYHTPKLSGLPWLDKAPRPIKRWMFGKIVKLLDKQAGPQVNAFRAQVGLPPLASCSTWFNSPQRIIGLFPEWFAAPQADWPAQTRLTGFLQYDGPNDCGSVALPATLRNFLDAGKPAIIFTLGTAMRQSRQFFAESIKACRMIGWRGIMITQYRDQLPDVLPEGIYHADYVPFSALFPHAAAVVYSGGIGTLSQVLAAGTPHLVVPMSHDQPDNAARIAQMGVGAVIPFKDYTAARATRKLTTLLGSSLVRERCRAYVGKLNPLQAVESACDLIEALIPVEAH